MLIFSGYSLYRDAIYLLQPEAFISWMSTDLLDSDYYIYNWYFVDMFVVVFNGFIYYGLAQQAHEQIIKIIRVRAGGRKQVMILYKYFTMLVSFIKLDTILTIFFVFSIIFFQYSTLETITSIWTEFLFFGIVIYLMVYAIDSLIKRNERAYQYFGVFRTFVEILKLLYTMLIIVGIDGSYKISEAMIAEYGSLRFSVFMQELISISLFIPTLSLGRYIFQGFAKKKFFLIYDHCMKLYINQTFFNPVDKQILEEEIAREEISITKQTNNLKHQLVQECLYNKDLFLSYQEDVILNEDMAISQNQISFCYKFHKLLSMRMKITEVYFRDKRREFLKLG